MGDLSIGGLNVRVLMTSLDHQQNWSDEPGKKLVR